jgi:exosortase H (IPTLxxWG-CTERM-specific)
MGFSNMKRYAFVYFCLLTIMFGIETTPWAQSFTVGTWTQFLADFSSGLMQTFDNRVVVQGSDIRNGQTGYAVSIKSGCNGVEAAMILAAAILAYPAPWLKKLTGMVIGVLAIQVLNVVRIISLYYLGAWSQKALDIAHLYVWPGLIILDALVIFLLWIHWLGLHRHEPGVVA